MILEVLSIASNLIRIGESGAHADGENEKR